MLYGNEPTIFRHFVSLMFVSFNSSFKSSCKKSEFCISTFGYFSNVDFSVGSKSLSISIHITLALLFAKK